MSLRCLWIGCVSILLSTNAVADSVSDVGRCQGFFSHEERLSPADDIKTAMNRLQDYLNSAAAFLYAAKSANDRDADESFIASSLLRAADDVDAAAKWSALASRHAFGQLRPTRAARLEEKDQAGFLQSYAAGMSAFAKLLARYETALRRQAANPPAIRDFREAMDLRMSVETFANHGHRSMR